MLKTQHCHHRNTLYFNIFENHASKAYSLKYHIFHKPLHNQRCFFFFFFYKNESLDCRSQRSALLLNITMSPLQVNVKICECEISSKANQQTKCSLSVFYEGWSPDTRYPRSFLKDARLLHWNGRFKPWNYPCVHLDIWEKWFIPDPTGKFTLVRP